MVQTMTAAVAGSGALRLTSLPVPQPGTGEVLVKVRAAALNRRDLSMATTTTEGAGRPIGMEWAGVIVAIGPEVEGGAAWGFGGLHRCWRLCRICRGRCPALLRAAGRFRFRPRRRPASYADDGA